VQLLAPFAPHLAEELWSRLGEPYSVHTSRWPTPNTTILRDQPVEIAVQVDGRVRARLEVAASDDEAHIMEAARRRLEGVIPSRTVYVPGRLVNFVTRG
jgi:leucyl-tRNA synthetase